MADRVLPSRELTQAWLDAGPLRGHPNSTDEWTIVQAYASGRLVDRETIDYEAAGEAAWRVIANEEGLIDEGLEWDDLVASDSQSFWIDVGKDTVNAVLFEGEAHREAG